jgi:hypothetical protein
MRSNIQLPPSDLECERRKNPAAAAEELAIEALLSLIGWRARAPRRTSREVSLKFSSDAVSVRLIEAGRTVGDGFALSGKRPLVALVDACRNAMRGAQP